MWRDTYYYGYIIVLSCAHLVNMICILYLREDTQKDATGANMQRLMADRLVLIWYLIVNKMKLIKILKIVLLLCIFSAGCAIYNNAKPLCGGCFKENVRWSDQLYYYNNTDEAYLFCNRCAKHALTIGYSTKIPNVVTEKHGWVKFKAIIVVNQ